MGKEKAQQYAQANEHAMGFIEQLVKEKNIDCDFPRQSAYLYTQTDEYAEKIQTSLGIKAEYIDKIPLLFAIKGAEHFDNQAQFHPRKYVLSLAKDIPGDGRYIFEQTRTVDVHEGNQVTVISKDGNKVIAERVVIFAHFPFTVQMGFILQECIQKDHMHLG